MESITLNPVVSAVLDRRSIRAYGPEPLSDAHCATILEAALMAPTARNLQSCMTVAITDKEYLTGLNAAVKTALQADGVDVAEDFCFYHNAPAFFLVAGDANNRWTDVDGGITVENMALAAQSLGLGSCIIGMVKDYLDSAAGRKWLDLLDIPANYRFVIGLAVGTPAESPAAKPRNRDNVRRR